MRATIIVQAATKKEIEEQAEKALTQFFDAPLTMCVYAPAVATQVELDGTVELWSCEVTGWDGKD